MQGAAPSAGDPLWDSSSRTRNLHAAPARIFGGPSVLHSDCDLQNAGFHMGSVKRQPGTEWLLGPRSRELDTGGPTTALHFASGGKGPERWSSSVITVFEFTLSGRV